MLSRVCSTARSPPSSSASPRGPQRAARWRPSPRRSLKSGPRPSHLRRLSRSRRKRLLRACPGARHRSPASRAAAVGRRQSSTSEALAVAGEVAPMPGVEPPSKYERLAS
jgi:hypothetical protein